jgi:hypothetical protein
MTAKEIRTALAAIVTNKAVELKDRRIAALLIRGDIETIPTGAEELRDLCAALSHKGTKMEDVPLAFWNASQMRQKVEKLLKVKSEKKDKQGLSQADEALFAAVEAELPTKEADVAEAKADVAEAKDDAKV